MHLGRFHATISDLANHFTDADLTTKLLQCATTLTQYSATRDQASLELFKNQLAGFYAAAVVQDEDLHQPYATQIIEELSIKHLLSPDINNHVQEIVESRSFDHISLSADLKNFSQEINDKVSHILHMNEAFTQLGVEFERVYDNESEIGILLPREIVGETLQDLTEEFSALSKIFRAINELTAAENYDPKVRTISSSWWQVFVELDATQIGIWVIAIERIITLFKTNLEIKSLQQQLSEKSMPDKIIKMIEQEVAERVNTEIEKIAKDIRKEHSKIDDESRLNEIETQLKFGFRHIAKRINQGAQIEINVSLPLKQKPVDTEETDINEPNKLSTEEIDAKIKNLSALKARARSVSTSTLTTDTSSQLLIDHEDKKAGTNKKHVG